jgi:hypothetical protein
MKLWLLLLCIMLTVGLAYGQDIITRTDGKRIEAIIQDTSPTQIRFKLFSQPEGPTYLISTLDVLSVVGADGVHRTFSPPTPASVNGTKSFESQLGRNLLLLHLFDFILNNFTFSYEHVLPSRTLGLRVPVSIGLSRWEKYQGDYRENVIFKTGLGVNFYPFGQGKFTFYVGPAAQIGFFRGMYYYDPYLPQEPVTGHVVEGKAITGGIYHFTRWFFGSAEAGLGVRRVSHPNNYYYNRDFNTNVMASFNMHLGLRF